jgi:sarcosine oxidase, subunit beta
MRRAAVAVIGGGVIGASLAWHLAARGRRDIVVLDRAAAPGAGSTGRATGGFRAQFGTAVNVRLSLLAREKLLRFREEIGVDPGYAPVGYLCVATSTAELAVLAEARAVQQAEGLEEAAEVTPAEIADLNPAIRLDGVIGGAFCPSDGFIRPLAILQGYLAAAGRLGARVEWGVEVTGMRRGAGGRVTRVETTGGALAVDSVVNAAGPWAAGIAGMAGVPLPVTPLRRQIAVTVPCDRLPPDMPMTIWLGDGFHLRVRDGRVLLLRPTPGVPDRPFEASVDPSWVETVAATARVRVPVISEVAIEQAACAAGLYEMSPDKHAILGLAPECPNLYLINGSSGHGVMHAPALGQLLAELMCEGRASAMAVSELDYARFVRGSGNPASELL